MDESRKESILSELEELNAEYDVRRSALDDYIDDEEAELDDIREDINRLLAELNEG